MLEHFPLVDRLHTDVLEEKYGLIHSKIIIHNNLLRLAHLIDKNGVSRTFAITFFLDNWTEDVRKINTEIRNGESIGKAFRQHQYAIRKNVLEVYNIKIPDWLQKEFDTTEDHAKARLSEFYAKKKGSPPVIYEVVVEIYSPEFRKAIINKTDRAQESALTIALEKQGFSKEEVWKRIGRENDYEDKKREFVIAKKESTLIERKFKRRINAILKDKEEFVKQPI